MAPPDRRKTRPVPMPQIRVPVGGVQPVPMPQIDVESGIAMNPGPYPDAAARRRLPPARFEGDDPYGVPPAEGLEMQPDRSLFYEDPRIVPQRPPSSTLLSQAARRQLPSPPSVGPGWQDQAGQQRSLRSLYLDHPQPTVPPVAPAATRGRWQRPTSPDELDERMTTAEKLVRENDLRRMERRARFPRFSAFMREWSEPGSENRRIELAQQREQALAKTYADLGIPRPVGGFTGRSITDPATYEDVWAATETERQRDRRLKLQRERSMMLRAFKIDPGRLDPAALWHILNDEVLDEKWLKFAPAPMPTVETLGGFQMARDPITGGLTKLGPAPNQQPQQLPEPGKVYWEQGANAGRGGARMIPAPKQGVSPQQKAAEKYQKDLARWGKERFGVEEQARKGIGEAELKRDQAMQRLNNAEAFLPDGRPNPDGPSPADIQKDREDIAQAELAIAYWKQHLEGHDRLKPTPPPMAEPGAPAGADGRAGFPAPGTEQAPAEQPGAYYDGDAAMQMAKKMWTNRTNHPEPERARIIYSELTQGLRFPDHLARIVMANAGIPTESLGGPQAPQAGLPTGGPAAGANAPVVQDQPGQGDPFTTNKDLVAEGKRLFMGGFGIEEVQGAMKALLEHAGYDAKQAETMSYYLAAEAEAESVGTADGEDEEE